MKHVRLRGQFARHLMAKAAAGALLGAGAMSMSAAYAQTTAEADTVIVTGSRVRGVAPVGSTVVSINRADIEASGAVTTAQLIQQIPQVFNLGISETSRGQSGGSNNITYGNSVNLRGIGPFTTLVILDGHRVVPQGTTGFAVDPSIIPTLALARVEVVPDGASAIYGSDAIAGVVNLILRRDFEGFEVTGRYGAGDEIDERKVGFIGGKKWGGGQVTVSYENGYRSALSGLDRDYFRGDLRARGGNDFRVTNCAPGNIVAGATYPIPASGVTPATSATLAPGAANRCDNLQYADLIPEQDRNSMAITFNQQLGERLSLFGDAFASRRLFKIRGGVTNLPLSVPATNAFFVLPPGGVTSPCPATAGAPAGTRCETVQYSFLNDYPQAFTKGFSKAVEVTVGARYILPAGWNFETSYTAGRNDDRSTGYNIANASALAEALRSANPATAFNPFGAGGNSASVINSILIGVADNKGRTTLKFYETKLDGPLFSMPGGQVKGVVGLEHQDMRVVQTNFQGTTLVTTATSGRRQRQVESYYAEVLVPIVGDANAMPAIHKLDVNLAARYDEYSDVGVTQNPKVGLSYAPVKDLAFRASYGTSFRAPTISQIYGNSNSLFVQNYSDPTIGGAIRQGVARSGANLNLEPETARTWSFGFDLTPDALPRSKFAITYFKIDYDNQVVSYLSDLSILSREAQFAGTDIIVRNPSAAFIAQQIAETGFTGVIPAGVSLFIEGRNANLAETRAEGVDFSASYGFSTEQWGHFDVSLDGTYFLKYETAITAAAPAIDQLNDIFNPLTLKMRGSLTWNRGPLMGNVFVNYQNAYDNTAVTPVQKVDAYTTVDLRLAYRVGTEQPFTIALDMRNAFDQQPPFVNIAQSQNGGGGFDPTLTNPIGRIIGISLDKRF